jgi:hypothetical protein
MGAGAVLGMVGSLFGDIVQALVVVSTSLGRHVPPMGAMFGMDGTGNAPESRANHGRRRSPRGVRVLPRRMMQALLLPRMIADRARRFHIGPHASHVAHERDTPVFRATHGRRGRVQVIKSPAIQ